MLSDVKNIKKEAADAILRKGYASIVTKIRENVTQDEFDQILAITAERDRHREESDGVLMAANIEKGVK